MEDQNILNQFLGFLDTPDIFLNDPNGTIASFQFPKIAITPELINDLEKLDHPRNSVLGKRMESFFEIAIKNSSRYELIASNLQIIENKQTLGEIDFLVFDNEKHKPLHVELVYKLYIYDPAFDSEIKRWIGPNRRDSFSEKLQKLTSSQFPLLYKSETSRYLDKLKISPDDIEQQLCFKAQLFTPDRLEPAEHYFVNKHCFTGTYYKLNDFFEMDWQQNRFYSPRKKNWSCHPRDNKNWENIEELKQNIQPLFEKNKSPLIWMKSKSDFYRFFIVWW